MIEYQVKVVEHNEVLDCIREEALDNWEPVFIYPGTFNKTHSICFRREVKEKVTITTLANKEFLVDAEQFAKIIYQVITDDEKITKYGEVNDPTLCIGIDDMVDIRKLTNQILDALIKNQQQ